MPSLPVFVAAVPAACAKVFSPDNLDELARSCGLRRRAARKLSAHALLSACLASVGASVSSFHCLAAFAGLLHNLVVSRQALHARFTPTLLAFLRAVLAQVMGAATAGCDASLPATSPVRRILLQDSTCLSLNARLRAFFPGSSNQSGGQATLKFQCTLDLLAHRFVAFSLSGFTRNDQAAASDILAHVRPGDLILRDLGYFVLESFRQLAAAGAFFLSRYSQACLFESDGSAFNLGQVLLHTHRTHRPGESLDLAVLLGQEARLPVRLVAVKLERRVAAERRRRARADRDRRLRPTAQTLALLDWSIYVTNLPQTHFGAQKVGSLYGLRWRIESVFKTFKKSALRLPQVFSPRVSATQVEALAYAALILTVLSTRLCAPQPLSGHAARATTSPDQNAPASVRCGARSTLKIARLLSLFLLPLLLEWSGQADTSLSQRLLRQIEVHGRYDARKRPNFLAHLQHVLTLR